MDAETTFTPPYAIPWATFLSTVERIAADPPGRVDRTYLDNQSGNTQTYLIAALKGFRLIDAEARPSGVLEYADADKRKAKVADLLREFYPTQVALGETNATMGQLQESFAETFPGTTGESKVKAIRFFMSAMSYAELPLAPLWGTVKAPRGASGRKGGTRRTTRASAQTQTEREPQSPSVTSEDAMRAEYFRLLLDKAKTADDTDLLDRIERLVGVSAQPEKAARRKREKAVPAQAPTEMPADEAAVEASE